MNFLTKEEAKVWCLDRRMNLDEDGKPEPNFEGFSGVDFMIPEDTGRRVALANTLFEAVPGDQGTLVWITSWGIWPSSERRHMFDRFRSSYGDGRPIAEAPAFAFGPSEREDTLSFFTFTMLFLYDCHVLSESGDTWIFISHDEVGWACSKRGPVELEGFEELVR